MSILGLTISYRIIEKKTMEWLDAMCSHLPNMDDQMVRYYGFRNTVRHYSTTGNPHSNSESKTLDL
jgi:hypothetical protein